MQATVALLLNIPVLGSRSKNVTCHSKSGGGRSKSMGGHSKSLQIQLSIPINDFAKLFFFT